MKVPQDVIQRIRRIAPRTAWHLERGHIYDDVDDDKGDPLDPLVEVWGAEYYNRLSGRVYIPHANHNNLIFVSYCKRCDKFAYEIYQAAGGDIAGHGNHKMTKEYIKGIDEFCQHFIVDHISGNFKG